MKSIRKKNGAELFATARHGVGRFGSMLKIYDYLLSLLELNHVPPYFKDKEDLRKSWTVFYFLTISFIFSLFDPKWTDIRNLSLIVKGKDTKKLLDQISKDWQIVGPQVTRIRHNMGFHAGKKLAQFDNAFKAFDELSKNETTLMGIMRKLKLLDGLLEQEIKDTPNQLIWPPS